MRKYNSHSWALGIFFTIGILAMVGWAWNFIKIFQTFDDVLTGMFIARCIGVFVAPLGAVLGWF
jgi:polyferredoxin